MNVTMSATPVASYIPTLADLLEDEAGLINFTNEYETLVEELLTSELLHIEKIMTNFPNPTSATWWRLGSDSPLANRIITHEFNVSHNGVQYPFHDLQLIVTTMNA